MPTVVSPPGSAFTAHRTFVVGVPASSAWNWADRFTKIDAVVGVMVSCPSTRNTTVEVALPSGAVTEILPVAAPLGTLVTRRVGAASVTLAPAPAKVTEFCAGVALKPVPKIWTWVPTLPAVGVTRVMRTGPRCWAASKRSTRSRLPVAS